MSMQVDEKPEHQNLLPFLGFSILLVALNMWSMDPLNGARPPFQDTQLSRPFQEQCDDIMAWEALKRSRSS